MEYTAHRDGQRRQTIIEHLNGTEKLSGSFAASFGAEDEGRFCAMLHDIGKYSAKFQRRVDGSAETVDHSTAGALEAKKMKNIPAAFCIAGHHAGLPNGGSSVNTADSSTLMGRLSRIPGQNIEKYDAYADDVKAANAAMPGNLCTRDNVMFSIRMLYSCLVDADYLDTERFFSGENSDRGNFPPLTQYREKLKKYTADWLVKPEGKLGQLRNEILRSAIACGTLSRGLFTFTAPTGSGKTIASMSFALEHAAAQGLERIIYVIPYCSIIEQTLGKFEEIFGKENVVAHYSDAEFDTGENVRDKRYLATENWDAPVILTTTVQFFESLYAKSPSRCRKLHNIANSVIVFDEAQMLPLPFLKPCLDAISQLVTNYGCSAVLCTATQPALTKLFASLPVGAPKVEICPRPEEMYELFRRVLYESVGVLTDDELAARLEEHRQVLCIVNRRDQAQKIYAMLPEEGKYHLSTAMCPADRRKKLDEIRDRLKAGQVCRVVSTSLVEAGVDLDFPVVFRALAGLDSIVQAGGRCNREGKNSLENSVVYIFESEKSAPRMLEQKVSAARNAMRKSSDPASPQAIKEYFSELFYISMGEDALDAAQILKLCKQGDFPFVTIAERFRVIDTNQFTIYIPKPENAKLLEQLESFDPSRTLMRKLGQYAVGVYPQHYKQLQGYIRAISGIDGAAILSDESLYNENTGLELTVEEGRALFT